MINHRQGATGNAPLPDDTSAEETGTALLPEPDMTALADDADPEALADRAAQWRAVGAAWREHAGELTAQAAGIEAAARAQAEEIIQAGRKRAALVSGEAAALARDASEVTERARILSVAARHRAQAIAAAGQLAVLEAELQRARETITEADAELPRLQAERDDVNRHLAAARQAGDLDAMTGRKTRLSAIEDLISTVTARRDTARATASRLRKPGGPLDSARNATSAGGSVTQVLDRFFHDRPGALERNLARSARQARGW